MEPTRSLPLACPEVTNRSCNGNRRAAGYWLLSIAAGCITSTAMAHDGLDLPSPISEPEAWNVIQQCTANTTKLIADQQWSEISIQLALVGQSARFLRDRNSGGLAAQWSALDQLGVVVIRAALQKEASEVVRFYAQYRADLAELEKKADPAVVRAPVYSCPMCRGVRELDAKIECFKCGMKLAPRTIPASSLYNIPGEPSIILSSIRSEPLIEGKRATVTVRLTRKKDGAPITPDDLLIVHTERIHLLIVDESLTDYHHEHPRPTGTPGEYEFAFTPRKQGSYRIFADIVPGVSNVQEYAVCDLPGAVKHGEAIAKLGSPGTSSAGGLLFNLGWNTGGLPVRAKQPVSVAVSVADSQGRAFADLEPLMGAYAHVVAFHEDRTTVLHIHPTGAEPQKPQDRGGPKFLFRFWAPKPGFFRLYLQVQVGGRSLFAPFGLTVEG
jgi:hypothetical protein